MIIVHEVHKNFLSCYLKCHKNALLRRNSHQFGSLDTNQQYCSHKYNVEPENRGGGGGGGGGGGI